jgi:hypothetical protein|tara:strand:- start:501 stop:719 length:219 start_codon:yes stop_codon:yes gene_type:complete
MKRSQASSITGRAGGSERPQHLSPIINKHAIMPNGINNSTMTNRAPAGILKPVRPPPRKDSQMAGSERHGIP